MLQPSIWQNPRDGTVFRFRRPAKTGSVGSVGPNMPQVRPFEHELSTGSGSKHACDVAMFVAMVEGRNFIGTNGG